MINEMTTLIYSLRDENIPFEVEVCLDGSYQVWYPSRDNCVCDVICNKYSYGHEQGLLEMMGLLTDEEREADTGGDFSVVGWLTANDVFKRIEDHYNSYNEHYVEIPFI